MTNSVRSTDPPLVDPETGETAPLSPQRKPPKCDHPLLLDCCPAYCAICHEQIREPFDAA